MELPRSSGSRELRQRTGSLGQHLHGVLEGSTVTAPRALGERYLQRTRVHRRGAPRFIDGMPATSRTSG